MSYIYCFQIINEILAIFQQVLYILDNNLVLFAQFLKNSLFNAHIWRRYIFFNKFSFNLTPSSRSEFRRTLLA
jgi:hypothetical protein